MPELRPRARRNCPNPITQPNSPVVAVGTHPRRKIAAAEAETRKNRKQNNVIAGDEIVNVLNNNNIAGGDKEKQLKKNKKQKSTPDRVFGAEEAMDEYDSGGRSADKGPGAEDEGSTAPIPEKVVLISFH